MLGGYTMKHALLKILAVFILGLFLIGPSITSGIIQQELYDQPLHNGMMDLPPLKTAVSGIQSPQSSDINYTSNPGVNEQYLPSNYDISKFLENNELSYQKVWEPWLTKAAVRVIATDPSYEFLAVGGGYLYDNEIHIYRWNGINREYDKVWDSGDMIIQGDVLSIDFGDTDNNDFMEIVAGSADGHVYVFEQEHIYDPFDNMENQFVHVWTSPKIQQVWGVKVADVDKDYLPDIIAGSWDGKIHVYEYINHSGYPFTKAHWIEYAEKTTIPVGEKIYSIATGDTNNNNLPEIVAGTQSGRVYIYENNGTVLKINGIDWPLTQDNSYRYHWDSKNVSWKPIIRTIVDNLDNDPHDEIVYLSMGQNVFVVNFDPSIGTKGRYLTHQLWEPFDSWELGGFEGLGHYLNHYIDFMTWSNNNETGNNEEHVYNEEGNYRVLEPYAYPWEPQWPKNTSMAIHRKLDPWGETGVSIVDPPINHPPAENYTTFNALNTHASAVVDWGKDQEVMGDGLWAIPEALLGYDVILRFHESTIPNLNQLSFEISQDQEIWVEIPKEAISTAKVSIASGDDDLLIDIDPILSAQKWGYFRYMRINVTNNGFFKIKGGYAPVMFRPLDAATSITIGHLDLDYYRAYATGQQEGKKIVAGTADGKIIMFEYDAASKGYNLLWNSYKNDSYTYGTNIWDIVEVKSPGKIPTWLYNDSSSAIIDIPFELNQLEIELALPIGSYGDFYSVSQVSLFSAFFEAIFNEVPAYAPLKDIVDLKIPRNDLVIGTTNGKLMVIPELNHHYSTLANFFFAYVNSDPFYAGNSLTTTFVDLNSDQDYFPEVMLLGWGKEESLYNPEEIEGNKAWAGMDVYTYDPIIGPLGTYAGKLELQDLELTGLLSRAFEKSRNIPDAAVGDADGDGDMDIVITNGRIYYVENIANTFFILDSDYFLDLNTQTTDKLFTSPELYDFDQDGDLDLTVSFSNRAGSTYFENVGNRWAPEWKEDKWLYTNSWGGLRFNNLTSSSLGLDKWSRAERLITFNNWTQEIYELEAEYDNHNAFVIGTNPIIARLEMNLKSGTDTHGNMLANYGYHVFETWNSEAELKYWTMTLKTGDTDQDGRKEVIVGDYDSNMYVFEHLTNNTYKRAYRSQDVTHDELSLTSPYAYQDLEGVSGTFYRKIWDHIEELVVNLDMDGDGFQEIVATAGLSIFVWEQRNDGFVSIDDEFTLIWQADLRQSPWAPLFYELGVTEFTASAWGGDLDYNGLGEFILAAGSFLFVFESNGADQFGDNFLVNPWPVRGRYFVPGNPFTSPAVRLLSIESIVVGDTDNDTLNEIIIGGVNKTWWGQYNGFVAILENQIGTYDFTWRAPSHLMEDNPVYDLAIDNQDLDFYKEIIVGTFKGIVIYENGRDPIYNNRDNYYYERSILTSYVNFPYIKLKQMFDIEAKVHLALRNTDFIELQTDLNANFKKSQWIQIFKAGNYLYYATSPDYGDTWIQRGRVTTSNIYSRELTFVGGFATTSMMFSNYEYHPSIFQTKDGRVWLAFTGSLSFTYGTYTGIWLLELKEASGSMWWENAVFETVNDYRTVAISGGGHFLYNPSVWEFTNNTNFGVAISYMNSTDGGIYWRGTFRPSAIIHGARIPNIGASSYQNNQTFGTVGYQAFSHDTIKSASGKVIIVFSGRSFIEGKLDIDLWIAKGNSTPIWDGKFSYSRATSDGIDELHPSITQTVTDDHTLMVIFEADGFKPSGALQIIYSKNDGETWRDPEPVTTTPPFATYVTVPYFGFSLMVLKDYPFIIVKSLISVGPAITAHWEGGFAYSFMAQYHFFIPVGYAATQKASISSYTVGAGYSGSFQNSGAVKLSSGDISSHSGLVENVGGGMTTGGGTLSYSGETIGTFSNLTVGGGGSAIVYANSGYASATVEYTTPIVSGDQSFTAYGGNIVAYGDDAAGTDNPENDPYAGSGYPDGSGYAASLAHGFRGQDFHKDRQDTDRGYYNNIFFGMNPSSNFTQFDFKEARAISVGDSDKDARREIAVASGSQVFLVEVARTGGDKFESDHVQYYYQAWYSDSLATPTTDIEFFDANNNGMDEIIVSCEQGNVYSFEGINKNPLPTNYLYLDWDPLWANTSWKTQYGNLDPSPQTIGGKTDIGNDGIDDLLNAVSDPHSVGYNGFPQLIAYNGQTGIPFWTFNLSNYLTKNSSILYLETAIDFNQDNTNDVVFLAYSYDQSILFLIGFKISPIGVTEQWETVKFLSVDASAIKEFLLHDITNDGVPDIFIAIKDIVYFVDGSTGNNDEGPQVFYDLNDNLWTIEHLDFGNSTIAVSSRKYSSPNGTVSIIHFNGSISYNFSMNNSYQGLTAGLIDFTGDMVEDIVIIESGAIFVFDGVLINDTYPQLWNETFNGAIGNYNDFIKYDFNSDLTTDLLIQLKLNGGSITQDFEYLAGSKVGNQSLGLIFSNPSPALGDGWTIWNSGSSSTYVPHSGTNTAYTHEINNYIIIREKAKYASAWFSTGSLAGEFYWSAYDEYGKLLDRKSFLPDTPTQFVELYDPNGCIFKLVVSGSVSGWETRYVIDDLTYFNPSPASKLLALSGLDPRNPLWQYHLWDTYANEIHLDDFDRDSEPDDLLFLTVYNPGYDHTGAVNVIDGTYGTPMMNHQVGGQVTSIVGGNFGEYGELVYLTDRGYVYMVTFVRVIPTVFQEVAIQMESPNSFESRGIIIQMATGSFNLDGIDDIVFGDSKRYIIALDGFTGEMIWKYRVPSPIYRIALMELTGDSYSDIAVTLKSGLLYLINGETGRPLWKDYLGPIIVNDMKFIDIESDGEYELAISMGFTFTANLGRFILYNTTRDENTGTGTIRMQKWMIAPYTKIKFADFNGDNTPDIAVQIYGKGIQIINGADGTNINAIVGPVQDFGIGNFTGSALPGIVYIMRNGTILTYEGTSNWGSYYIKAQINLMTPLRLSHLAVGDFRGDELDDIVVRSMGYATYCFDGVLNEIWTFMDRSFYYLPKFELADLNNDSKLDIISFNYDNILALSGKYREPTQVLWASFVPAALIRSMTLGDFNADGVTDVAVGTVDRWVHFLYGKSEQLITQSINIESNLVPQENSYLTLNSLLPKNIRQNEIHILLILFFSFSFYFVSNSFRFIQRRRR